MTLNEIIYHRKSCRSFTGEPVDAEMIEKILSFELKPLYPDVKVRMDIVSRDKVKCICPWTTPQLIAVYSEEAEGYLENIGFLFQQIDLYLHIEAVISPYCNAGYGQDESQNRRRSGGHEVRHYARLRPSQGGAAAP